MTRRTIRRCNPNGHGYIRLICEDEFDTPTYYVTTPDDQDGTDFDGNLTQANAYYDEIVVEYAKTPNLDAQAEYDDRWGGPLEYPKY